MDHVREGKSLKHFQYPPSISSDEEIKAFADGLKTSIPLKLEELLNRYDFLKSKRSNALRFVLRKTRKGSPEEYFLTLLAEHEFVEVIVIQKWLQYWLAIWQKATNRPLPPKFQAKIDKIDGFTKNKANQHPIKDLYEGQLKLSGSRLTGLCPFHQEKTPSFFIYPNNTWFCFGACSIGGDAITFIMILKGLTFPAAVRYLL